MVNSVLYHLRYIITSLKTGVVKPSTPSRSAASLTLLLLPVKGTSSRYVFGSKYEFHFKLESLSRAYEINNLKYDNTGKGSCSLHILRRNQKPTDIFDTEALSMDSFQL